MYHSLGKFIASGQLRIADGATQNAERYLRTVADVRFAFDRPIKWLLVADCYARSDALPRTSYYGVRCGCSKCCTVLYPLVRQRRQKRLRRLHWQGA